MNWNLKQKPYYQQFLAHGSVYSMWNLDRPIIAGGSAAIGLERGCGKTVLAIGLIGELNHSKLSRSVCIYTEEKRITHWKMDFEEFANFDYILRILPGDGGKADVMTRNEDDEGLVVTLVDHKAAMSVQREIAEGLVDFVICDGGGILYDPYSEKAQAIYELSDTARFRLMLTGYQLPKSVKAIFGICRFLNQNNSYLPNDIRSDMKTFLSESYIRFSKKICSQRMKAGSNMEQIY